ncbi:MAG: sulfotransferase family 2 domain-containing protein [Sphingobacteriaceae bacterium]|nr:sulfotransferase family 2 domain-containing protein [Sphingobacteriaceae bacterium]
MSTVKKQFLFVHIPKTAGTSFALILAKRFKGLRKLQFYSPKERERYPKVEASEKENYDLIYGHIPFIGNQGLKRGMEYFTFFRTPRERLLSQYKHIKGDGNHIIKSKVNVDEYSLKDFLKQGIVKNFDNLMTRYLSGNINKDYLKINNEDLELAIKNFDANFNIFGLTEKFDESLVLLSDYMNWPPLLYVRENKSSFKINPEEFDEETESLIQACNQFDDVLFKHAKAKFDKLLESKKEFVEKGVKELREGSEKNRPSILFKNKINLLYAYFRQVLARI